MAKTKLTQPEEESRFNMSLAEGHLFDKIGRALPHEMANNNPDPAKPRPKMTPPY